MWNRYASAEAKRARASGPWPTTFWAFVEVGPNYGATVRLITLTAFVAIAVLHGATVAHASPSKAEFIRRGDVICTQTRQALAPIQKRAQAAKSLPTDAKWRATADVWADQIAIQRRFIGIFLCGSFSDRTRVGTIVQCSKVTADSGADFF